MSPEGLPAVRHAAALTECHLARGDLARAVSTGDIVRAFDDVPRPPRRSGGLHPRRARVRAGGRRPALAPVHRGQRSPSARLDDPDLVPWRSGAALALTRLHRPREADRLAHEHLALAGTPGRRTPWRTRCAPPPPPTPTARRLALLREAQAILKDVEAPTTRRPGRHRPRRAAHPPGRRRRSARGRRPAPRRGGVRRPRGPVPAPEPDPRHPRADRRGAAPDPQRDAGQPHRHRADDRPVGGGRADQPRDRRRARPSPSRPSSGTSRTSTASSKIRGRSPAWPTRWASPSQLARCRARSSSGRGRASRRRARRRRRARTSAQVVRDRRTGRGDLGQHPRALVADPVAARRRPPARSSSRGSGAGRRPRGRRSPRCGTPPPGPCSAASLDQRRAARRAGRRPARARRVGAGHLDRRRQRAPAARPARARPGWPARPSRRRRSRRAGSGRCRRARRPPAASRRERNAPRHARTSSARTRAGGHRDRPRCPRRRSSGRGRGTARRSPRPRAARAARRPRRRERRGQGRQPADLVGLRRRGRGSSPGSSRRRRAGRRAAPAYGPGAGTPCQRAAAKTRLGCCLTGGRSASQASTSGSPATPRAHSAKQGELAGVQRAKSGYCSTVPAYGSTGRRHQPAGRATYVVSRYSSIPSKPPSRPNPLAFTPPNGAAGLETRPVLMPTMPKSSDSASRIVRARSRV